MKKLVLLVGVLILSLQCAEAQQSFGGGGHVGISISSFPKAVSDFYGLGFGGGAHADYNVFRFLTTRFNIDFHTFGYDHKKAEELIAQNNGVAAADVKFEGFRMSAFGFTVNGLGKIPTKSMVTPYGLIGFGMHIVSVSDPKILYREQDVTANFNLPKDIGETKFGINFGAGSEFAFGGFKMFVEFKYVIVFTKDESTAHMPITIGFGI
jgi:opacity protein-like surface antigen